MGDSLREALNVQNKMEESVASGATLEVSVSFGRFENDSLSWDKWSSFSQNKYLEEVGKCSTPGSVAQKAAYFEAHYKKIAAQKAEQIGQEDKKMEINRLTTNDENGEIHAGNTSGTDAEFKIAIVQSFAEEIEQVTNPNGVLNSSHSGESKENVTSAIECQISSVDEAKEELDSIPDSLELNKPQNVVLTQESTYISGNQENFELPPVMVQEVTNLNGPQGQVQLRPELEEIRNSLKNKNENANLDASIKSPKMTPNQRERNLAGTKKKTASPLPHKSPQKSTPKMLKPTTTSTAMSASRSTTKRGNGLSLASSKNPSAGEKKKIAPSSLHMSLSLSPANSGSNPLSTTRKSLIMEKMGDKDIVKRAFKTFQNHFNQVRSPGFERSSTQQEVSTTGSEQKYSSSLTPQKENEGSLKGASMDQRNAKPVPSSTGLRSDERAEKRREFPKKLEDKTYAKVAEKTRLHSKPKEEKLSQSPNFKATSIPGSYPSHATPKSLLDKEGAKNEHRRLTRNAPGERFMLNYPS